MPLIKRLKQIEKVQEVKVHPNGVRVAAMVMDVGAAGQPCHGDPDGVIRTRDVHLAGDIPVSRPWDDGFEA